MDYYLIMGMVAACLIVFIGVYAQMKKSYKEDVEQLQDLNENIIKLNLNFESMLARDIERDAKIKETRKEMFEIKDRVVETEHELANHESRIRGLEYNQRNGKQ